MLVVVLIVEFNILGIDFDEQCTVLIENGVVKVYYEGELLKNKIDYTYEVMLQSDLKNSVHVQNGWYLNTYDVYRYYAVSGKGKFTGMIQKTLKTQEIKTEKTTFKKEN